MMHTKWLYKHRKVKALNKNIFFEISEIMINNNNQGGIIFFNYIRGRKSFWNNIRGRNSCCSPSHHYAFKSKKLFSTEKCKMAWFCYIKAFLFKIKMLVESTMEFFTQLGGRLVDVAVCSRSYSQIYFPFIEGVNSEMFRKPECQKIWDRQVLKLV